MVAAEDIPQGTAEPDQSQDYCRILRAEGDEHDEESAWRPRSRGCGEQPDTNLMKRNDMAIKKRNPVWEVSFLKILGGSRYLEC